MIDLSALFDTLPQPFSSSSDGARFSAAPIQGYDMHRLAKDEQGAPVLLLSTSSQPGKARPAPLVLENLAVQHDVDCRITQAGGSLEVEEGCFTVIRCTGGDKLLHRHFLRIAGSLISSLPITPSRLDITRAVDSLSELFRAMARPPRKSTQGLWAELLLIARARDPVIVASAWHSTPEDLCDFSLGEQRIEVKSASGSVRQHYFTLEQLHPPAGATLLVASTLVLRAGGGTSLLELADQVRAQVSGKPDLLLHVDRTIALTLGHNWKTAMEERFDREAADHSLLFFESGAVPTVDPDLPPGISEVRFKADLTGKEPADIRHFRSLGGLFHAALRR